MNERLKERGEAMAALTVRVGELEGLTRELKVQMDNVTQWNISQNGSASATRKRVDTIFMVLIGTLGTTLVGTIAAGVNIVISLGR